MTVAITDTLFQNNIDDRILMANSMVGDLSNLLVFVAVISSNNHATPRKEGETSGYLVPAGFRLRVVAQFICNDTGTISQIGLSSAESDVGFSSGSAPSNPTVSGVQTQNDLAASTNEFRDYGLVVSAGEYLYFYSAQNATIFIYGYLEAE